MIVKVASLCVIMIISATLHITENSLEQGGNRVRKLSLTDADNEGH